MKTFNASKLTDKRKFLYSSTRFYIYLRMVSIKKIYKSIEMLNILSNSHLSNSFNDWPSCL